MTLTRFLRILAWLLLAGLVFVTLSPVELRPISGLPVQIERAVALAVIGFVFAVAYPRHIWLVAALVLGATVALELLQLVMPGRDARVIDVAAKIAGGMAGLAAGWTVERFRLRN